MKVNQFFQHFHTFAKRFGCSRIAKIFLKTENKKEISETLSHTRVAKCFGFHIKINHQFPMAESCPIVAIKLKNILAKSVSGSQLCRFSVKSGQK